MLLKISWRNIWRNTKRSILIIVSVSIGLFAGIVLMAFYNGMIEQRINSAIKTEVSHIQLHHPEFKKDFDIQFFIENGSEILKKIKLNPDVNAASGRIIIKGMIASPSGSAGISINGIYPKDEQKCTDLYQKIVTGKYFSGTFKNEILIGEILAKKLKLKINKKTILTFQDKNGTIISAAFRVSGIFKTVNAPFDESNVFVTINDIESLAGLKNQLNEIAVILYSNKTLEKSQSNLRSNYPKLDIQNWMEVTPELGLTVSVGQQMGYILMAIILMALSFGIVNTMMMAVLERTKEIGMLLALGMNKAKIFVMILFETVFLVLAGTPIGIGFSLIFIAITNQTGINFNRYNEVYSSFGYSTTIYPSISPFQLLMILILVIITAILSALYPAYKAIQLTPAESIKK